MEPICFGIIKGEQPLIRASRASKGGERRAITLAFHLFGLSSARI